MGEPVPWAFGRATRVDSQDPGEFTQDHRQEPQDGDHRTCRPGGSAKEWQRRYPPAQMIEYEDNVGCET